MSVDEIVMRGGGASFDDQVFERLLREGERRAVDALRLSEAHFRTLVENAPEAIVVLDRPDQLTRNFFEQNDAGHVGAQDIA